MIKLRLEGTVGEIEEFAEWLEQMPRVKLLSQSGNYANRGKSTYSRKFLEVELTSVQEFLQGVKE